MHGQRLRESRFLISACILTYCQKPDQNINSYHVTLQPIDPSHNSDHETYSLYHQFAPVLMTSTKTVCNFFMSSLISELVKFVLISIEGTGRNINTCTDYGTTGTGLANFALLSGVSRYT